MTRFSACGDEDGHEFRKRMRASKKPRISTADSGQISANSPRPSRSVGLWPPITRSEESEMESEAALSDYERFSPAEEPDDDEEEEEEEEEEGEEEEEEQTHQPNRDASAPVTVTLTDPDVLDCPICLEPLSPPVYQCENGHISCASCCSKMKNKCGTCNWPIGYNRCRAIEKVVESVKIACKNMQYGCGVINYSKRHDHEKTCIYIPCACPYYSCTHVSICNSLYNHFDTVHAHASKKFYFNIAFSITVGTSQRHFFLQEKNENILFILDHTNDFLGSFMSVVCIAPTSSKRSFSYDISAKDGTSSIRVKTVAENMPKLVSLSRAKKLFLMPKDFIVSIGQIKVELMIQSASK